MTTHPDPEINRLIQEAVAAERRAGNAHLDTERRHHAREMQEQRLRLIQESEKARRIAAQVYRLIPADSTRKTIPAADLRALLWDDA